MKVLNSNHTLVLKLSLFLYIFSLIFHNFNIYELAIGINPKLSELIFIPFLLTLIFFAYKFKFKISVSQNDFLIILFCCISILHLFWVNSYKNYFYDILINIYFLLIFFTFKILINENFKNKIINYIKFSSLIASIIAIVGWTIFQLKLTNYFVLDYEYPFKISESGRAKSLFEHPNAMFNFIIFAFLIYLVEAFKNKKKLSFFLLIIILLALLLSFSKSFFILIGLVFYLFFLNNYKFKKIFLFLSIIFFSAYIILSHLIIIHKESKNYDYYTSSTFVNQNRDKKIDLFNYDIYLNNYFEMKLESISYWKKNILFGNNSLEFLSFKRKTISDENFNQNTNNHHSTYFGILANKGILGILLYFIILFNFLKSYKSQTIIGRSSFLFLIFLLIEGLNSDLLTLKLTWILFALLETSNKSKI